MTLRGHGSAVYIDSIFITSDLSMNRSQKNGYIKGSWSPFFKQQSHVKGFVHWIM